MNIKVKIEKKTITATHKLVPVIVLETVISCRLVTCCICKKNTHGLTALLVREMDVWKLNLCDWIYICTRHFHPRRLVRGRTYRLLLINCREDVCYFLDLALEFPHCKDLSNGQLMTNCLYYRRSFPRRLPFEHSIWIKWFALPLRLPRPRNEHVILSRHNSNESLSDVTIAINGRSLLRNFTNGMLTALTSNTI